RRAIIQRLEVDPAKVTVIGVAVGAEFVPTPLADAARARSGLAGSYVLFVGNFKPHKNVDSLLRAWASLPATLRPAHPLVLGAGSGGRRRGRRGRARRGAGARAPRARASRRPATPRPRARVRLCARPHRRPRARPPREPRRSAGGGDALMCGIAGWVGAGGGNREVLA